MSYQVKNTLILNQSTYHIIKATNDGLITPEDLEIKTKYYSSRLMRGYLSSYKLDVELNLILNDFSVYVNMDDGIKLINGMPPHISSKTDLKSRTTYRKYININLKVIYSGYILIGNKMIENSNTMYGIHGAEYEDVFELKVQKGKVISINNLSDKILHYRMKSKQGDSELDVKHTTLDNEIQKWQFKDL